MRHAPDTHNIVQVLTENTHVSILERVMLYSILDESHSKTGSYLEEVQITPETHPEYRTSRTIGGIHAQLIVKGLIKSETISRTERFVKAVIPEHLLEDDSSDETEEDA